MAYLHGGRHGCPSRAKTPGAPPTSCYPSHSTPDGSEVTEALGGETPLHAPCGAQSGSTPLPHPERLDTRRKRQGLDINGLPSVNQQMDRTSGADGCYTHAPSGDRPLRTYSPGILQRLWHRGGGGMAEPVQIGDKSHVATPLAARHYQGTNLGR